MGELLMRVAAASVDFLPWLSEGKAAGWKGGICWGKYELQGNFILPEV
ncbi:hypothetical protein [Dyadobacter helix]|nr:hypothetical protein [Dyadobacter sp. CECT 9275]